MKQVLLSRKLLENSCMKMVTWLSEEGIKEGLSISLKGSKHIWNIEKVYHLSIEKENINRNWNVGGL